MTSSTPRDDSRPGGEGSPGLDHTAHAKEAGAVVYLMEELGDARMRCDQLLRYVDRAVKLVEKSSHKDHFFEVAGDLIRGIPETVFKLHKALEAVALAANRIDYEEIKQDLRPEKVEELERVLKDVRVRQVQRRSLPMVNPTDAVQQLQNLAKRAKEEGQLDTAALSTLIACLEAGKPTKVASAEGVAGQLEAMVHALQNPPKGELPSRQRLAQVLRKIYGEHVDVAGTVDGRVARRKMPQLQVGDIVKRDLDQPGPGGDPNEKGVIVELSDSYERTGWLMVKWPSRSEPSRGSAWGLKLFRRKRSASAEDAKRSRFEEGKPADPTKHMAPEDAKAWKQNTEEYGDKFKKEAAKPSEAAQVSLNTAILGIRQLLRGAGSPKRTLHGVVSSLAQAAENLGQEGRITVALQKAAMTINQAFSVADMRDFADGTSVMAAEDEKLSRFEEGKPADPTKHMDPEDAKAWKENTDEYGDKFKKKEASSKTAKSVPPPDQSVIDEVMSWHGGMGTKLYSVGSRWQAGRSVDADDAEEVFDELTRRRADRDALNDLEEHLVSHGVSVG